MRLRRLRRRLSLAGLSGPRVAVRRALPWPLRWLAAAVVLGLCAALALWTFELGRSLAGLDAGSRQELQRLRGQAHDALGENRRLREAAQALQDAADAAAGVRATEHAAMESLAERLRQLEADNRGLRDDLAFFEKLIPASRGGGTMDIRGLQAEVLGDGVQLRWQVLVIQPARDAPEFKGRLELVLAGLRQGQPWTSRPPAVNRDLRVQTYRRVEGVVDLPAQLVVKTITVRLLEGDSVRAMQSLSLN